MVCGGVCRDAWIPSVSRVEGWRDGGWLGVGESVAEMREFPVCQEAQMGGLLKVRTGDQPGQQQDPASKTAINGSDLKRNARPKQWSSAEDGRSWEVTCGVKV